MNHKTVRYQRREKSGKTASLIIIDRQGWVLRLVVHRKCGEGS